MSMNVNEKDKKFIIPVDAKTVEDKFEPFKNPQKKENDNASPVSPMREVDKKLLRDKIKLEKNTNIPEFIPEINFIPSPNLIIMKPILPQTETKSGIIIPPDAQSGRFGVLVEVGEQIHIRKAGEVVRLKMRWVSKNNNGEAPYIEIPNGDELIIDDVLYYLITSSDILAIYKDKFVPTKAEYDALINSEPKQLNTKSEPIENVDVDRVIDKHTIITKIKIT